MQAHTQAAAEADEDRFFRHALSMKASKSGGCNTAGVVPLEWGSTDGQYRQYSRVQENAASIRHHLTV